MKYPWLLSQASGLRTRTSQGLFPSAQPQDTPSAASCSRSVISAHSTCSEILVSHTACLVCSPPSPFLLHSAFSKRLDAFSSCIHSPIFQCFHLLENLPGCPLGTLNTVCSKPTFHLHAKAFQPRHVPWLRPQGPNLKTVSVLHSILSLTPLLCLTNCKSPDVSTPTISSNPPPLYLIHIYRIVSGRVLPCSSLTSSSLASLPPVPSCRLFQSCLSKAQVPSRHALAYSLVFSPPTPHSLGPPLQSMLLIQPSVTPSPRKKFLCFLLVPTSPPAFFYCSTNDMLTLVTNLH